MAFLVLLMVLAYSFNIRESDCWQFYSLCIIYRVDWLVLVAVCFSCVIMLSEILMQILMARTWWVQGWCLRNQLILIWSKRTSEVTLILFQAMTVLELTLTNRYSNALFIWLKMVDNKMYQFEVCTRTICWRYQSIVLQICRRSGHYRDPLEWETAKWT